MKYLLATAVVAALIATPAAAQVKVYGPGGPAPAVREAAAQFEKDTGIDIEVVSGPTPQWIENARKDADVIFSGSDTMMTDFVRALPTALRQADVQPLYDRPAAILVRKGNPAKIKGFRDLLRGDLDVMVVEGAGQNGLWEDLASRAGGIGFLRKLRPRIGVFAANSAEAREKWIAEPGIDAWIIWGIWQTANPAIADQVSIEREIVLYRPMAVATTTSSDQKADAHAFTAFLASKKGADIFRRHGWRAPADVRGRGAHRR